MQSEIPSQSQRNGIRINITLLVGIINAIVLITGFVGGYVITTARLQDAMANASNQTALLRVEIDNLRTREQAAIDNNSANSGITAVHLATIERDIKYIQQIIEDMKHQQPR